MLAGGRPVPPYAHGPSVLPGSGSGEAQLHPGVPDRLWVADITYVRTWEGWHYLAFVLDTYSRKVVGWSMANNLGTEFVLDAVNIAIYTRRPQPGLIHHSDRGSQYTSVEFGSRLTKAELLPSMGSVADPATLIFLFTSMLSLASGLFDQTSCHAR